MTIIIHGLRKNYQVISSMSFWKLFDKNCFACGKWIWNNKAEFLSDFIVWLSYLGSLYLEFTTGTLPLFGRDYNHMELVLELFILIYRVGKKNSGFSKCVEIKIVHVQIPKFVMCHNVCHHVCICILSSSELYM